MDFEKINSLEGVFIANRYDVEHTHDASFHQKFAGKREFTEGDLQQARMDKMRHSQQD